MQGATFSGGDECLRDCPTTCPPHAPSRGQQRSFLTSVTDPQVNVTVHSPRLGDDRVVGVSSDRPGARPAAGLGEGNRRLCAGATEPAARRPATRHSALTVPRWRPRRDGRRYVESLPGAEMLGAHRGERGTHRRVCVRVRMMPVGCVAKMAGWQRAERSCDRLEEKHHGNRDSEVV